MTLDEIDAFAKGMTPVMARMVDEATAPLLTRIGALEKELADRPAPENGKDADRAEIERMVAEAVAAIPPAKDGESVDPETVKAMVAEAVAGLPAPKDGESVDPEAVKALVDEAVAALPKPKDGENIDPETVRTMVAEAVAEIPKPQDGKSFTAEDAAPLIAEEVARAVSALPPAEPGKDADPEAVREIVHAEVEAAAAKPEDIERQIGERVAEAVAAIPSAKDGEPGKDADPVHIAELVAEAVSALPKPADGKSVTLEDITPLVVETVERSVAALPPPKDGIGLAGALIDRAGNLVVTLTDGTQRELGPVIGKDGEPGKDAEPGKDGADGLGFEDLDLSFDGERKLVATFTKGEVSKAIEIEFPVIIDRGVYKAGKAYLRGDAVTWGGALWIAQRDTSDKPETSDAFRLAVKMGRNGQDGKNGERGEKGDPGRDGKALT